MVVNKNSYRMCAKIKKYIKILLFEFLNEDHILYCILLCKDFFGQNICSYSYTIILSKYICRIKLIMFSVSNGNNR